MGVVMVVAVVWVRPQMVVAEREETVVSLEGAVGLGQELLGERLEVLVAQGEEAKYESGHGRR
jgi:hypothetical protein